MGKYVIMTDSSCDLSEEYIKEHGLDVLNLLYNMDGTIYGEDKTMDIKEFYAKMRGGSMPTTMAVNPEEVANAMRRHLEQGEDILYIAFSSGLSASCQNAVLGANDVRDDFPDRKIIVVDSLCASMGQGLFVHYALKRQAEGIAAAKARGVKFGRPHKPLPDNFYESNCAWRCNEMTLRQAAKACGMPLSTFYTKSMQLDSSV